MPRYTDAIEWIALNDEPTYLEVDAIKSLISVCLVADLFGKTTELVASDVSLYRRGACTVRFARALQLRK